jgi:hypothetical protein
MNAPHLQVSIIIIWKAEAFRYIRAAIESKADLFSWNEFPYSDGDIMPAKSKGVA